MQDVLYAITLHMDMLPAQLVMLHAIVILRVQFVMCHATHTLPKVDAILVIQHAIQVIPIAYLAIALVILIAPVFVIHYAIQVIQRAIATVPAMIIQRV
jgi:hypothetical protein